MERTHYRLPECSFALLGVFSLIASGLTGGLYLLLV
jgi:hypothetical protein